MQWILKVIIGWGIVVTFIVCIVQCANLRDEARELAQERAAAAIELQLTEGLRDLLTKPEIAWWTVEASPELVGMSPEVYIGFDPGELHRVLLSPIPLDEISPNWHVIIRGTAWNGNDAMHDTSDRVYVWAIDARRYATYEQWTRDPDSRGHRRHRVAELVGMLSVRRGAPR